MKLRTLLSTSLLALIVGGGGPAAAEDAGRPHREHIVRHIGRVSVERAAMRNILAEQLSARTGRSAAEIADMFESAPPPEAARQLGLSEADMKAVIDQARTALIQRATAAGLITPEQAEQIRMAPRNERMGPPPFSGRSGQNREG